MNKRAEEKERNEGVEEEKAGRGLGEEPVEGEFEGKKKGENKGRSRPLQRYEENSRRGLEN